MLYAPLRKRPEKLVYMGKSFWAYRFQHDSRLEYKRFHGEAMALVKTKKDAGDRVKLRSIGST